MPRDEQLVEVIVRPRRVGRDRRQAVSLNERYMDRLQVAFIAWIRADVALAHPEHGGAVHYSGARVRVTERRVRGAYGASDRLDRDRRQRVGNRRRRRSSPPDPRLRPRRPR